MTAKNYLKKKKYLKKQTQQKPSCSFQCAPFNAKILRINWEEW